MLRFIRRFAVLSACAASIFLSGCADFENTAPPSTSTIPLSSGSIYGGQQPLVGAHVYLYAANKTAYGGAATSLMVPGATGTLTDGNGVAYVTSGADGSFSYGGTYANCTSGTQIYLLSLGGLANGLTGSSNGAITLAATLGDCANLTTSTVTQVNEVTTVATAYALRGFMTAPTQVGAPTTNLTGLATAFTTAGSLVSTTTGHALITTPGVGNGVAPQAFVNTLGNIIAACVNSASGSAACATLFTDTTLAGGSAPTDTMTALLNIAAQPGTQTANLYGLAAAMAPFQPSLTSQPNDFALGIAYAPTGITNAKPGAVVIDASGNIWTSNCQSCFVSTAVDTLLEFSSSGALLHSYNGSSNATTQVLHSIQGIALDATSANIYTVNQGISGGASPGTGDDQVIKMSTTTGLVQSGFPLDFDQGTYGVDAFNGIALDNSGEIWVTANNAGIVNELTPTGLLINGSPFYVGGTIGVAADSSGNIWFAGTSGNNILQWDTYGDFLNDFTPSSLNQPYNAALDGSSNLWTINKGSAATLSKIALNPNATPSATATDATGSPFTNLNINAATMVAIDGTNQVLIPNCRASCSGSGSSSPDNLLRINSAGVVNTGTASGTNRGAQLPNFSGVGGAAIDASGNVWVSDVIGGRLTEVIGFASPTVQPIAKAAQNGKIGTLP